MNRLTVAELKQVKAESYCDNQASISVPSVTFYVPALPSSVLQLVARPDVVEMHDVTAQEPKLLVHLKATRNTVPVPRHWCFKRKYLQGKRGIEKPPFELPEFIKKTGIQEMREALQEKVGYKTYVGVFFHPPWNSDIDSFLFNLQEDAKTMKTKMREKVRPKMGKIDIDYQKLHDAFFKWQIKPKLTIHGDLYYEVLERHHFKHVC